ncbi:kinesin-like protein KIN-12B [Fagus crenata]
MAYDSKQSPATAAKLKSQLPSRPPSSNPLNRKLIMETVPENSICGASDSGVQRELPIFSSSKIGPSYESHSLN